MQDEEKQDNNNNDNNKWIYRIDFINSRPQVCPILRKESLLTSCNESEEILRVAKSPKEWTFSKDNSSAPYIPLHSYPLRTVVVLR